LGLWLCLAGSLTLLGAALLALRRPKVAPAPKERGGRRPARRRRRSQPCPRSPVSPGAGPPDLQPCGVRVIDRPTTSQYRVTAEERRQRQFEDLACRSVVLISPSAGLEC
jgi:hypothetical protein